MMIEKRAYGILDVIRIPVKCSPSPAILISLLIISNGIMPAVQVVVTADFIDTAIYIARNHADISLIFPSLFAVVALIAYSWVSVSLRKFAEVRIELAIRDRFRTAIVEKRARMAYKHIENDKTWNLISRVSETPEVQIKTAFTDLISMVSGSIQIAGLLFLLIIQVWWAALLICAFSIPLFALAVKSGRANYQANREVSKYKRKYEYLSQVLTGRETVDERTLFGFGDKVNERWHEQYEAARKIEFRTAMKWFIKMKTGGIVTALISILVMLVLLNPVLTGAVTVGMFISLVNAIFGLVQAMSWELTYHVDQLAKHNEYLKDLTEFAALDETGEAVELPVFPLPAFESLEFRNVRFKYPGTDNYVLDGISFRIDAGKHYAFVGINGSGKTTITKLMTGLYDDFEGDILINGRSISTYSQREIKALFSVVYQDFARYYISINDNIALGDVNKMQEEENPERVREAIMKAGLEETAAKLPLGLDTPLGKIKEGGQDVSGGEWQKIAMARAVFNPAPVRILDEPTASLDPVSESRMYKEFEKISRDKTTIFISHRLGSTKLAHEIFVLGNGRIIEKGDHQHLMNLDGVYAQMYESQRSWYE